MGETSHKSWRVRSSEYIHQDKWIAVRADDCVTPAGVEVAPFYVLEYPDWVHIIALDPHDNLILVQQYRHGVACMSTEVPAGRMDADDESPLTAAARELAEETGYVSDDLKLIATMSPNPATHANHIHVVLALNAQAKTTAAPDPAEDLTIRIIPYREALQMIVAGTFVHAPQIASLLLALARAGKVNL
jgi:8-oxo-dGDP phosphatase